MFKKIVAVLVLATLIPSVHAKDPGPTDYAYANLVIKEASKTGQPIRVIGTFLTDVTMQQYLVKQKEEAICLEPFPRGSKAPIICDVENHLGVWLLNNGMLVEPLR